MVTSINSNIAAYFAQASIGIAESNVSSSVARLSSGNAIVKASDNVAALSIGTGLAFQVATLKVAQQNTSLGTSLLQVADGGLAQQQSILQQMQALATQANSGSLSSTQRGFLDQQFQALSQQLNSIASGTQFNGVNLLDGSLSQQANVGSTTTQSTAGTATLTFTTNPAANNTVIIDGITITAKASGATGAQFNIGGTIGQSVANLASVLNTLAAGANSTTLGQATYAAQGNTLIITSKTGGSLGTNFKIDMSGTATTGGLAGIGAQYGGANTLLLSNTAGKKGFASSTTAVAAGVAADATPFVTGDLITAKIGAGAALTLYTIANGDTLQNIVSGINANTTTTGISAVLTYDTTTSTYNVQLNTTDGSAAANTINTISLGANFENGVGSPTHAAGANSAAPNSVYGLQGAADNGLGFTSTSVTGTTGDNILTALAQTAAQVQIAFPNVAASALTNAANFGSNGSTFITIAGHIFGFTSNAASGKAPDEITIGATLQATLDNAVSTINSYLSSGAAVQDAAYELNQIKVSRSGNSLVFTGKNLSTIKNVSGATSTIAITGFTGVSATNSGNLNNSNVGGVDMTGLSNQAFTGTINGFTATYNSANNVNISVKVGNYTYTATSVNTNPLSNTTVRFFSANAADGTNGGYFDVFMQANDGLTAASQTDANTFASRFNAAFSSLSFSQERNVNSYSGTQTIVTNGTVTGSLVGSKVAMQIPNFTGARLNSVSVSAPQGSSTDGQITIVVNGETFSTAAGLSSQLGANQTYRLISTSNANDFIDFTTGNSSIDFSTAAKATSFQNALQQAFGVGNGSAALTFQVGTSSTDALQVSIASVSSSSLFGGQSFDVLTQADAAAASTAVNTALNSVTATRASVGALESRFNYASANLSSSIQNQDAARSQELDTDVASESTKFAIAQVGLQAGIATLAQANQELQSLLKLVG